MEQAGQQLAARQVAGGADQHHHLREQFSAERENILAHTRRISHFDQIEQIKDYPDQVRKLLARIHRVKAHLLLKRII